MPLTDTAIKNAKPGQKTVKLFDANGLYLEVSPSGGKWWRLKCRLAGKEKRLSLGTYPETTLKMAREKRQATYLPQRAVMMQAWADHVDALHKGGEVIPFKAV